jgi:hypothetical protein
LPSPSLPSSSVHAYELGNNKQLPPFHQMDRPDRAPGDFLISGWPSASIHAATEVLTYSIAVVLE